MILFLRLNGYRLEAPDDEALGRALEAVLLRELSEEAFGDRIARYVRLS